MNLSIAGFGGPTNLVFLVNNRTLWLIVTLDVKQSP